MKDVRKIIYVCIWMVIISISLVASVQATSTTIVVNIPEITKPPDTYATLPITVASVENYGVGTISITYDSEVVHVISVSDGPDSTVTAWNADNITGIVKISAWNLNSVSGDIVFANVKFKAVGSAGLFTPLKLNVTTLTDTSGGDIAATIVDGAFSIVKEAEDGTSNGNGGSGGSDGRRSDFELIATPTPTPTPLSPTPTPTSPATPTPTITIPSSPTETEIGEAKANATPTPGMVASQRKIIPGFEALFACTALLIAYLLLFRKGIRRERK